MAVNRDSRFADPGKQGQRWVELHGKTMAGAKLQKVEGAYHSKPQASCRRQLGGIRNDESAVPWL